MLKIGGMDEVLLNHEPMIFTWKLINPVVKSMKILRWHEGGESI
jgi:hypothetical protein